MDLSPEAMAAIATAGGGIIGIGGKWVIDRFRAEKAEKRADYDGANSAWMKYAQHQEDRCAALEKCQEALTCAVREQGKRLDDCNAKHADCEERNDKLEQRVNELEGSVRVVENKIANG